MVQKSINTKDRLYKVLIQTDSSNTVLYERILDEFKQYRADRIEKVYKKSQITLASLINTNMT